MTDKGSQRQHNKLSELKQIFLFLDRGLQATLLFILTLR